MQSTEVIEVIVPEPPMGCSLALSDRGALCTVEAVQPASRAAGAGVREGDVLTCVEIDQCEMLEVAGQRITAEQDNRDLYVRNREHRWEEGDSRDAGQSTIMYRSKSASISVNWS